MKPRGQAARLSDHRFLYRRPHFRFSGAVQGLRVLALGLGHVKEASSLTASSEILKACLTSANNVAAVLMLQTLLLRMIAKWPTFHLAAWMKWFPATAMLQPDEPHE